MDGSQHAHIYLSPHLDDVALSCGAGLHAQVRAGERVLVVSCMAGSPPDALLTAYSEELKLRWGNEADPVAARRREDREAMRVLGAQALHLAFLDCPYRTGGQDHRPLYPTESSIFGPVHPAESDWPDALLDTLREHVPGLPSARLYAPLTAGHHVDHVLVRRAAVLLLAQGQDVTFYEDYPYAGDKVAVEAALEPWEPACWSSYVTPLDEEVVQAKVQAIACYTSQISTFWQDTDEMRRRVQADGLRTGGGQLAERYWRVTRRCVGLRSAPMDPQ